MKIILLTILFYSTQVFSHGKENVDHSIHAHSADAKLVDGKLENLDSNRFYEFISDLKGHKVAVVSVKGMVCDFCARGIEKTFRKDKTIQKINVDLSRGKVILAYSIDKEIVREEISRNILINGQNMTDLQVITIN